MALNCTPLDPNNFPYRLRGEKFILQRSHMEFEFKLKNKNIHKGEGKAILTSIRLICINEKSNPTFHVFEIPISLIIETVYAQKEHALNYLTGRCNPLRSLIPGDITFNIYFHKGGNGTFVNAFLKMFDDSKKDKNRIVDKQLIKYFLKYKDKKLGYRDQSDPCEVFETQPKLIKQNPYEPMTEFLGENPYAELLNRKLKEKGKNSTPREKHANLKQIMENNDLSNDEDSNNSNESSENSIVNNYSNYFLFNNRFGMIGDSNFNRTNSNQISEKNIFKENQEIIDNSSQYNPFEDKTLFFQANQNNNQIISTNYTNESIQLPPVTLNENYQQSRLSDPENPFSERDIYTPEEQMFLTETVDIWSDNIDTSVIEGVKTEKSKKNYKKYFKKIFDIPRNKYMQ